MTNPEIAYICDKGNVRKENQDRVFISKNDRIVLCAVADGMGGTDDGGYASDIVIDEINKWCKKYFSDLKIHTKDKISLLLYDAVIEANYKVVNYCREKGVKAGTTLTILLIVDDFGIILYSGDTRLYRLRNKMTEQLTEDETLYNYYEDYENGMNNNHRNKDILFSYIGKSESLAINIKTANIIQNDIFVICTDGMYNYINFYNDHVIDKISDYTAKESVQFFAKEVKKQRAADNLSIVIVKNQ